jgi:hypothetical protein
MLKGERVIRPKQKANMRFARKTSQIGGFAGGQQTLFMLDESQFSIVRKMNGARDRAQ